MRDGRRGDLLRLRVKRDDLRQRIDQRIAVGHLGQYVLVSPGQKLTVVRLGKTDQPDRDALVEALAKIVALYPET